jgi:type III secretion protein L
MGSFVKCLSNKALNLDPSRKVLKAKDYLAYGNAKALLEQAQQDAETMRTQTQEAFEAEKQRGYQQGLEQGKLEIAEQMIDTVSNTLEYLASIEKQVAQIVIQVLRKVLGEFDDAELTLRVVDNALNAVRNQKEITLRVAPEQVEAINRKIHTLLGNYQSIAFVKVTGDRRLSRGGCILETEIGVVDASIDVQLQALERSLAKCFSKNGTTN